MAHSSAKSRLFTELSRSRTSSANGDEFATAGSGSFDMNNEQIINSTVNMGNNTTQQPLPLHYDEHPSYVASEQGSEGSEDMSIEIGRGVMRDGRDRDADVSSNIVFSFGGDSQYEITGTPPMRPRNVSRKSDSVLRREASIRNATEAAKSKDASRRPASHSKHRSLSETLAKLNADSDHSVIGEDYPQPTFTFNARNTRFTRSRQTSANEPAPPSRVTTTQAQDTTPRRQAPGNPTVQSATYTANSFMLPDLPNITELVSGVRNDGTPVFSRSTNKPTSRSRFTSVSYKPASQTQQYVPIQSVPIPEEEKAIFASLQLLKDKVAQLESERSEATKRAEEYEGEIIDLRSQLQAERRRPDSALGSDEESSKEEKWRIERTRLQASVKALQERFERSERKVAVGEIAGKRVTRERDELVTQIGVAYVRNEELVRENEGFREEYGRVVEENEELREEVQGLKGENERLRVLGAKAGETTRRSERRARERSPSKQEPAVRSRKEAKAASTEERSTRRRSSGPVEQPIEEDIASRIAREVQKHRSEAMATRVSERTAERETTRQRQSQTTSRSRSKSQHRHQSSSAGPDRRASNSRRSVSAPLDTDISEPETTTEQELTRRTRDTLRHMRLPSQAQPREEDSRDMTLLSWQDPVELAKLRKKIEEEYRAGKLRRNVSAPEQTQREETVRSAGGGMGVGMGMGMPRKSSLKDITAGLTEHGTGRFGFFGGGEGAEDAAAAKVAKTVRVQSPHTSDGSILPPQQQQQDTEVGDMSTLSNTSRRRRSRAASEEAMTSAFILPDITLHGNNINQPFPSTTGLGSGGGGGGGKSCIPHNASTCTACHPHASSDAITIPTPIPVTDRETPVDPDVTTATIRPAQPPALALATVIKNLEDEITHLKLQLEGQQSRYQQHDPALSKRQRLITKMRLERLTAQIERRSDQVYALHDVLEGQKEAAALAASSSSSSANGGKGGGVMERDEVEETLMSLGLDPAELSGRVGRSAPFGLGMDGAGDVSAGESEELPWEGLSEYESGSEGESG